MKKLFALVLFISYLQAGLVDAISVLVNNEPITLYEIDQRATQFKVSPKQALEDLVRYKIEAQEAKRLDIEIDKELIDKEVEVIAKRNRVSEKKLYELLLTTKGLNKEAFRAEIKERLLKKELYAKTSSKKLTQPTTQELQEFYEENIQNYMSSSFIDVTQYVSKSKKLLQQVKNNPMLQSAQVRIKDIAIDTSKINPNFARMLSATKEGAFTKILPNKNLFVMFYIIKHKEQKPLAFEKVRPILENQYYVSKREKVLKEYFSKLRENAEIKVLRKP